jgi:hypothetical protein
MTIALTGCIREEEALTDNVSGPIGDTSGQPATPPPAGSLSLTPPADMEAEATGPTTGVDIGLAVASGGDGNYSYSHDAPSEGFSVGSTVVTWTVTDGSNAQASATQSIVIADTTPPAISKPDDLVVVSTGTLTPVDIGQATVTDLVDTSPAIRNDKPDGGFGMGMTEVTWIATDASGNTATATQRITVRSPFSGPLAITAPSDLTIEATAKVTQADLGVAMTTGGAAPIRLRNDAPSTGFPLGQTLVTWTAADAVQAIATDTQTVTVRDTTPPSLSVPEDVSATQQSGQTNTAVDLGVATATDMVDDNPRVTNNAPANGFPLGETRVTWTATDASGNRTSDVQVVTVTAAVAESCSALLPDFRSVVFPIMDQASPKTCEGCHTGPTPVTTPNGFEFPNSPPNETDLGAFVTVANIQSERGSLVLEKALGNAGHAGGNRFPDGRADPDFAALSAFVARAENCVPEADLTSSKVELGTGFEQLHKITVALGGRVPTSDEARTVAAAGNSQAAIDQALDPIIDGLMNEKAFYDRVAEIYNDLLLTNRDAANRGPVAGNFDLAAFPRRGYYENFPTANGRRGNLRESANYGFARAPVELVKYVVRTGRPFTEIVTADYMMVNPYSAVILGVDANDPSFPFSATTNPANHSRFDFRPARFVRQANGNAVPLAGVIGTHSFLARYPSTPSNVNRKRARFVFEYFLGTNIEDLAARDGLDLESVKGVVPTYEDPQCTVCHDVMDPIAGLFTKRNVDGGYNDGNRYQHTRSIRGVPRMVKAGYSMDASDELPAANQNNPLVFLGKRIARDVRFANATVRTVLKGLTGIPAETASSIAFVNELRGRFQASNYNFKSLVKDIVVSDQFRAMNLAATEVSAAYPEVGSGRLLTSEELDRKIQSITGGAYRWRGPNTNSGLMGRHYLLYGGIDSNEIIKRTTSPTAFMNGIQKRIANQVACVRVADDLYNGGVLFPDVNERTTPQNGEAAIRDNIVFLHRHILGEDLGPRSVEVNATYQLWRDVRALNRTSIPGQCRSNGITTDTNRTVLPWMAVVTYLLSDFKFLYQ